MKSNIGYVILYVFVGYVLFELLKVVLAYPIGALAGGMNMDRDTAMALDTGLSAVVAGAAAVVLYLLQRKKRAGGKGDKG